MHGQMPHDDPGDLNSLVPAFLTADPESRRAALAVLRGEAVERDSAPPQPDTERFLNQQELGEVLGIHTTTIRRWAIPCHRLGRVPRYSMTEVHEYLASRAFKRRLGALKAARAGPE